MEDTTEREKARLLDSAEYKEFIRRKGTGQAAWNWQTREKELMKEQRLNNTATVVVNAAGHGGARKNQYIAQSQLRDQPSIGEDADLSLRMSGHEMLD